MILADKIISLRKKAGMSQEELADQMKVSRQAVSKWESAQSVPDLNRILKLSEIFGVSTDYLLKDELEEAEYVENSLSLEGADGEAIRQVSMEEADRFLEKNQKSSGRIALGTMLCILSPIVLLLLGGFSEYGNMKESAAVGIGLIVLMLMVAGAVALFVLTSVNMAPFQYLEKEKIETAYGVEGMVRERKERYASEHTRDLIIGITLCILATIPIFAMSLWTEEMEDMRGPLSICATLAMIAIGVCMIVRTSVIWGGFQKLLEEGDYERSRKKSDPIIGIYWMIVTAGYLAYSFITMDWGRSWIVWPVAGVICGIIYEIMKIRDK